MLGSPLFDVLDVVKKFLARNPLVTSRCALLRMGCASVVKLVFSGYKATPLLFFMVKVGRVAMAGQWKSTEPRGNNLKQSIGQKHRSVFSYGVTWLILNLKWINSWIRFLAYVGML